AAKAAHDFRVENTQLLNRIHSTNYRRAGILTRIAREEDKALNRHSPLWGKVTFDIDRPRQPAREATAASSRRKWTVSETWAAGPRNAPPDPDPANLWLSHL